MHRKLTYPLFTASGCIDQDGNKIQSLTMRTTDGEDETYAAKQADARGTGQSEELIRVSLMEYTVGPDKDNQRVVSIKQPFIGFDKWSTKARHFVGIAWRSLASPNEAELADFLGNATEVE